MMGLGIAAPGLQINQNRLPRTGISDGQFVHKAAYKVAQKVAL